MSLHGFQHFPKELLIFSKNRVQTVHKWYFNCSVFQTKSNEFREATWDWK